MVSNNLAVARMAESSLSDLIKKLQPWEFKWLVCESHLMFGSPRAKWKISNDDFKCFVLEAVLMVLVDYPEWKLLLISALPLNEMKDMSSLEKEIYRGNYFKDRPFTKDRLTKLWIQIFENMGIVMNGSTAEFAENQTDEVAFLILPMLVRARAIFLDLRIQPIMPGPGWMFIEHWGHIVKLMQSESAGFGNGQWAEMFWTIQSQGRRMLEDAVGFKHHVGDRSLNQVLASVNLNDVSSMDVENLETFNRLHNEEPDPELEEKRPASAKRATTPSLTTPSGLGAKPNQQDQRQQFKDDVRKKLSFQELGKAKVRSPELVQVSEIVEGKRQAIGLGSGVGAGAVGAVAGPSQVGQATQTPVRQAGTSAEAVRAKFSGQKQALIDELNKLTIQEREEMAKATPKSVGKKNPARAAKRQVNYKESLISPGATINTLDGTSQFFDCEDDSQFYFENSNGEMVEPTDNYTCYSSVDGGSSDEEFMETVFGISRSGASSVGTTPSKVNETKEEPMETSFTRSANPDGDAHLIQSTSYNRRASVASRINSINLPGGSVGAVNSSTVGTSGIRTPTASRNQFGNQNHVGMAMTSAAAPRMVRGAAGSKAIKPTPVIQVSNPKPFYGDADGLKVAREWLESLERYFKNIDQDLSNFPRETIVHLLQGEAGHWWNAHYDGVYITWAEFKDVFRRKWMPGYLEDPLQMYNSAVMKNAESSTSFLERVISWGKQAKVDMHGPEVINAWYLKLPSQIRVMLSGNMPLTMAEMLARVEQFERMEGPKCNDFVKQNASDYLQNLANQKVAAMEKQKIIDEYLQELKKQKAPASDRRRVAAMAVDEYDDYGYEDELTEEGYTEQMIMLTKSYEAAKKKLNAPRNFVRNAVKPHCNHEGHTPEDCWAQANCTKCGGYGHVAGSSKCFFCPFCPDVRHPPNTICEVQRFFMTQMDKLPEDVRQRSSLPTKSQHLNSNDQRN